MCNPDNQLELHFTYTFNLYLLRKKANLYENISLMRPKFIPLNYIIYLTTYFFGAEIENKGENVKSKRFWK